MTDAPDKAILLTLPPYAGYTACLGTDPAWWGVKSGPEAYDRALECKRRAEAAFPGLKVEVRDEPNSYPTSGPDPDVMETIAEWLLNYGDYGPF